MSVRSPDDRKISFDLLATDISGDDLRILLPRDNNDEGSRDSPTRRKRKSKSKRKNKSQHPLNGPAHFQPEPNGLGLGFTEPDCESSQGSSCVSYVELRQRNVSNGGRGMSSDVVAEVDMNIDKDDGGGRREGRTASSSSSSSSSLDSSAGKWTLSTSPREMVNEGGGVARLETMGSLDWKQVMASNPSLLKEVSPEKQSPLKYFMGEIYGGNSLRSTISAGNEKKRQKVYNTMFHVPVRCERVHKNIIGFVTLNFEVSPEKQSPLKYFMGEIYGGNSLRSTISAGNEKKRQKVYNTMFHVPVRCERVIIAGFFFCLDSFLSLLTIMPARILMTMWRVLKTRQFQRPNAAELSDFGCFIVLVSGVTILDLTDISLIYHIIRGQGTIKLYVVYNVLEIFDKLCQSFGEDVLQVLFNSAEGLAGCSADSLTFELLRFIFDAAIAVIAFILHSFVLLAQAITLSTCIIAHNNALMALLISNNFAEIKSNVFKRVSKENLQNLVYYDIIERFHITAFVLFVLAQNILEAEGPWFENFLMNAMQVYVCEMFIDTIKHSFLAKFNEIKPAAYSEFLEDLCKQTLNEKPEECRQDLTFIPLAPACVVIRVLTPIYSTLLPFGPLPWRLLWIVFWLSLTYIMLTICKILVGLSLRHLATWYLAQRQESKEHID